MVARASASPGISNRPGFEVVLGRFSLGWQPPEGDSAVEAWRQKQIKGVEWLADLPREGEAWHFLVVITDPGYDWSDDNAPEVTLVGRLDLSDGSNVWVVRFKLPTTDQLEAAVVRNAVGTPPQLLARKTDPERAVYRGHQMFPPGEEGPGSVVEIALNRNLPHEARPWPAGIMILESVGAPSAQQIASIPLHTPRRDLLLCFVRPLDADPLAVGPAATANAIRMTADRGAHEALWVRVPPPEPPRNPCWSRVSTRTG